MRKLNSKKMFALWVSVLAVGLIPMSALGDKAATPASDTDDMSLSDLSNKSNFKNFSITTTVTGNQTKATLFLSGFDDCLNKIRNQITASSDDPDMQTAGLVGFSISDPGDVYKSCMKSYIAGGHTCRDTACNKPIKIEMDVSNQHSGDVQVILHDPNDPNGMRGQSLTPAVLFKNQASLIALQAKTTADALAKRISDDKWKATHCTKDATIDDGYAAVFDLKDLVDSATHDKYLAGLATAELDNLEAKIEGASLDDLADMRVKVQDIVDANSNLADKGAEAMYKIALRYVHEDKVNAKSYKNATATIKEAEKFSDLSTENKAALKEIETRELPEGEFQLALQNGDTMTANRLYTKISKDLGKDYQKYCDATYLQKHQDDGAKCTDALNQIQTFSAIPAKVQTQQQQKVALQQQLQQSIMQAQGGSRIGQPLGAQGALGLGVQQLYNPLAGNTLGLSGGIWN